MINNAIIFLYRIPVRLRLTLWYVFLMGVTMATLSTFLLVRFEQSLTESLDQALENAVTRTLRTLDDEEGQLMFPEYEVPVSVSDAMARPPGQIAPATRVEVVGDGRKAGAALADAARADGHRARLHPKWLTGDPESALDAFLGAAEGGLTVGAGETAPRVTGGGRGGRNTHAALLAATRISGTDLVFAAFATDGVDGASGAAGAIVDGGTLARGGDATESIARFDSATYLESSDDLLVTGATGTNVADLWLLWRP